MKKIEFADGKYIDLTTLTLNPDSTLSPASYLLSTNIDTSIQEELILGYNDQMQISEDQDNPTSTYNASNYNTSGEQEEIDHEQYNEMQWRSYKKNRSAFGGAYTVWYKYYEQNLSGTNGNDRIVGHWIYCGWQSQQKQPKRLFLAINEHQPKADLGRESSSSRRRRKATKRFLAQKVFLVKSGKVLLKGSLVYFLNEKTINEVFVNDNFKNKCDLKFSKHQKI